MPDEDFNQHPLVAWMTQLLFDLVLGSIFERVVIAPQKLRLDPGTLIASNHQREVDGPLLGTVLVARKGLRFQRPLPFFAARDDLFRRGILSRLEIGWPRPIDALLSRLSLGWFFPLGRTEPILRVREFTLGDTFRALIEAGFGDTQCAALLNARGRRELGEQNSMLAVDKLARQRDLPLRAWWGLRRLTLASFQQLAPSFRATVEAQLHRFARELNGGHSVYFSPEGSISYDGRFGRIRAGFFHLAHLARTTPWIQPVAFSYDVFRPGRSRFIVRVGSRFRADLGLNRRDFDTFLRKRIIELAPVTPSHLLAWYLSHGPQSFTRNELTQWIGASVATLRTSQAPLDPMLEFGDPEQLVHRRLPWLKHKELITCDAAQFRNRYREDAAPGWGTPSAVVRYLGNNLADVVPDAMHVLTF